MLKNVLNTIAGDPNARVLKKIQPIVDEINEFESDLEALDDAGIRAKTDAFRSRLEGGESPDDILPEAFAVVREASKRTIGLRHYDVQMIGGVALHRGIVAEMKTGEGKTLVATLPLYLNALTGLGVQLVTPNDYLSKVGVQTMGPIYHFLGLSSGVIQNQGNSPQMASFLFDPEFQSDDDRYQHLRPVPRREVYAADITYGTNNEFGFDYLRDNMVWELRQRVQRPLNYAIVDEIDNILIDEARTPLIISGPAEEAAELYGRFAAFVRRLKVDDDYTVDEKTRAATPTDEGIEKLESMLGIDNLYSPDNYELTPYFENALKAHTLFHIDKQYIVVDGEVVIVDEFTGRQMPGRRFSEGLHQAIEAKEGVKVQRESMTLATITFQNYFRMYEKLAGMTGTAVTEAEELDRIYSLEVMAIPPDRPVIRIDRPDLVFTARRAKWKAVIEEIEAIHATGQPILVGTASVDTSEMLHQQLERRNIAHEVLNAKNHMREAEIIAQAGRIGALTIATNMAGRGVDILLGGNPEGIARHSLRKHQFDLSTLPSAEWDDAVIILRAGGDPVEKYPTDWARELKSAWHVCLDEREKVLEFGGLFVLGTERHEARRIDNQLRGRSGRQGDPGESRFYVSLEDDLMIRFGGERVKNLMERLGVDEEQEIESGLVSKQIEGAQGKVEGYNFDLRKHLLEYDEVINEQRRVIYQQRTEILKREELRPIVWDMLSEEVQSLVATYTGWGEAHDWDVDGLATAIRTVFEVPADESVEDWREWSPEEIGDHIMALAEDIYDSKVERLGEDVMLQMERAVMLRAIDQAWIRHLTALDELRTGVGLRAIGQEKPLNVFKKEGYAMFQSLVSVIAESAVRGVFLAEPASAEQNRAQAQHSKLLERARAQQVDLLRHAQAAGSGEVTPQPTVRATPKIGRNDPCHCGSGKKYKACHMRDDLAAEGVAAATGASGAPAQVGRSKKRRRRR